MKLLIITQQVDKDDDILGFFHRWIEEFAKHASEVAVIAGFVGKHNLPRNVFVYSLGKEKGISKIKRIWKFWELFSKYYADSEAVFFHMCPEFILAAAPFLVSLKRISALWYTHKSVTRRLRFAEKLVDYIFTASELSFRLPSKKAVYTGHAIDTEFFSPVSHQLSSGVLKMLTIGRISPIKNIEIMISACSILKDAHNPVSFSIVGKPAVFGDEKYYQSLKNLVHEKGLEQYVFFEGSRPYSDIPDILREHDLFINLSETGSLDKAVLEAMACGLSVISANEAFREILPQKYFLEHLSPEFLAERIRLLVDENRPNLTLRQIVLNGHSLEITIKRIISILAKNV